MLACEAAFVWRGGAKREGGLSATPLPHTRSLATLVLPRVATRHYVFLEEYLSERVHRSDTDSVVKVIDLGGLRRSDLTSDLKQMLRTGINIGKHYPGRTARLVLVNKPMWAGVLIMFIKALLSAAESKRMVSARARRTHAAQQGSALRTFATPNLA